ncbi:MAG: tRNA threonylcarbamoyladenosine dehydratase [Sphingobacteriia bacterium]|jgi:tRNA threonylcarbamoyladenosine dehydratase|nr:tRNA threonylcarbamoyladenosine dehydratase [Sphingobacteriia bacterium]
MENWLSRTQLLLGDKALQKLNQSHILVIGLGGVGAYAAEMLCRAGVGELTLVDADVVSETNINRQLVALHSTVGKPKIDVLAARLKDINPSIQLHLIQSFLRDEATKELLEATKYDFLVDAIDTLSPKVYLLYHAVQLHIPVVSSMGSGGKVAPEQIKIADISKSEYCRLAKMVRKRLYRLGIRKGIIVVYSPEKVEESSVELVENEQNKNSMVGTVSYMPAVFGCFMASYVIRVLCGNKNE